MSAIGNCSIVQCNCELFDANVGLDDLCKDFASEDNLRKEGRKNLNDLLPLLFLLANFTITDSLLVAFDGSSIDIGSAQSCITNSPQTV